MRSSDVPSTAPLAKYTSIESGTSLISALAKDDGMKEDPADQIPEIPLVPQPETAAAKEALGFKWAGKDSDGKVVGMRSKFGGAPDLLQPLDVVRCSCGKVMAHYAQIDSIGDKFILGDCGMIFVFVCFDCLEVKAVLQSA